VERLVIRLEGVSFAYRVGEPVLDHVGLEIVPGLSLLLGPNGCGKSSLLKLMAGVEHPDAGHIRVAGHDLWREEVAARRLLAYVPEHPDLSPYATVREILELVCGLRGRPLRESGDALEWVGLHGLGGRTVRELSKGQRRRAALAAARIATPPCLLLDEPLEGMDRGFRRSVVQWVVAQLEAGATVVIVSHDFDDFADHADAAFTVTGASIDAVHSLPPSGDHRMALLEALASGAMPPAERAR
jgi:ABC-type multidrug transport system ATPase subunit